MHVESWLTRAATGDPARTAIEACDGAMSYGALLQAARAGAQDLRQRGAKPGDRVAIALPAGLELAKALHACLLLEAVAVPVDLRLKAGERERIAADSAVVIEEPLLGVPASQRGHLSHPGSPTKTLMSDLPADPLPERHDLDAPAVVIHTSGTTSAPKPVVLTYGNLLWSALGSAVALGLDPGERWLCALPLSHVGGLSILLRSAIYGTTAVVHERFETDKALRALNEQDVTLVSLVATTLSRLLDAGLSDPPRLRCALTGGGPVPQALLDRARKAGVPVRQTYGLTECCSQAATAPQYKDGGVALFCTKVKIADDGEILICGPTVAPKARAQDGWLHTGDLGRLDQDGLLHVTGRKADTIVTGGENVSPVEVEAAIESHPEVVEAAALGRPDPQWGEAVEAIVVVAPGASLTAEQLHAHCAASLAPFKVPKRFTLVGEPLPRTGSGKLLRRQLR